MAQRFLIGNWKSNPAKEEEAVHLVSDIEADLEGVHGVTTVIAPPYPYLISVKSALRSSALGCQDISANTVGAFTGEVAAEQLADLGVQYAIIGHSERRKYNRETDKDIQAKMKTCLVADIIPILCVGAGLKPGDDESTIRAVIRKQFINATQNVYVPKILVAYEPSWAIGTGMSATPQHVDPICDFLRSVAEPDDIKEIYILYGGSVHAGNADEFRNIDGFLVGGASLDAREFVGIARAIAPKENE